MGAFGLLAAWLVVYGGSWLLFLLFSEICIKFVTAFLLVMLMISPDTQELRHFLFELRRGLSLASTALAWPGLKPPSICFACMILVFATDSNIA